MVSVVRNSATAYDADDAGDHSQDDVADDDGSADAENGDLTVDEVDDETRKMVMLLVTTKTDGECLGDGSHHDTTIFDEDADEHRAEDHADDGCDDHDGGDDRCEMINTVTMTTG